MSCISRLLTIVLTLSTVFYTHAGERVMDPIQYTELGISTTAYTDFSVRAVNSVARYSGRAKVGAAGNNILFSTNEVSGIFSSTSGGKLCNVTITWASGANESTVLYLYASTEPYTSLSDPSTRGESPIATLTGEIDQSIDFPASSDYRYFALLPGSATKLYITEIDVTWEIVESAQPGNVVVTLDNTTDQGDGQYEACNNVILTADAPSGQKAVVDFSGYTGYVTLNEAASTTSHKVYTLTGGPSLSYTAYAKVGNNSGTPVTGKVTFFTDLMAETDAPTIEPTGSVTMTLSSLTEGAEIDVEVVGKSGTQSSFTYTTPFRLTEESTVSATAHREGFESKTLLLSVPQRDSGSEEEDVAEYDSGVLEAWPFSDGQTEAMIGNVTWQLSTDGETSTLTTSHFHGAIRSVSVEASAADINLSVGSEAYIPAPSRSIISFLPSATSACGDINISFKQNGEEIPVSRISVSYYRPQVDNVADIIERLNEDEEFTITTRMIISYVSPMGYIYAIDNIEESGNGHSVMLAPSTLTQNVEKGHIIEAGWKGKLSRADHGMQQLIPVEDFNVGDAASWIPQPKFIPLDGNTIAAIEALKEGEIVTIQDLLIAWPSGSWLGAEYNGIVAGVHLNFTNRLTAFDSTIAVKYYDCTVAVGPRYSASHVSATNSPRRANTVSQIDREFFPIAYEQHTGGSTGIENVAAEAATEHYYNLQGIPVASPCNGVFMRVSGNKVEKVILP